MERRIKVTGTGKLAVKPDTFRLFLELTGIEHEYSEALDACADVTEELRDVFVRQGFQKDSLKTIHFDISSKYESYRDKHDDWKKRFVGYEYIHRFKIEFPLDNSRLGKILSAIGQSALSPEITIGYTIADPEGAKNELLAKAVSDSRRKAEILSAAAGVKIGTLVTIDYSWQELDVYASGTRGGDGMPLAKACNFAAEDMDIEPDDIDLTDSVTVIWSISDE